MQRPEPKPDHDDLHHCHDHDESLMMMIIIIMMIIMVFLVMIVRSCQQANKHLTDKWADKGQISVEKPNHSQIIIRGFKGLLEDLNH